MNTKIDSLIFGGAGFIGQHLYSHLERAGRNALSCDLIDTDSINMNSVICDVRNNIRITEKIAENAVIYNLAAIHTTPGHDDYEYFETNINGAKNTCRFAEENNVNTIVFISSIAPYGTSNDSKSESSLPLPNTAYGISKAIAEEIHKTWQAKDVEHRKLIILRPGVVFGKGEGGNFTRLYSSLSRRIFIYPGGKRTRKATIYVKDLVSISVEMVKSLSPGTHLYNMCYPEPPTIEEIVHSISFVTGVRKEIPTIPSWGLLVVSNILYNVGRLFGWKISGIHPDRVRKLMVSTNISGKKLKDHGFVLPHSLQDAIQDWFNDNENMYLK
jgi:GlcNAc-P-P-Und epimerase